MPTCSRHISNSRSRRSAAPCGRRRTKSQRDTIDQVLAEPIVVIPSPVFKRKNAEELIFDVPTTIPRLPVAWYCLAIDRATPPKRNTACLLTRDEETVLFRQYNYARLQIRVLQDQITKVDRPTDKDIDDMLRWYSTAIDRRDHIVECNLALVLAMAKRSWATGEYADLVAEGNVALIRCVDRFNCELGFKFSTYACRALSTAFNRFGRKQIKHKDNIPFEFDPDREPIHKSEEDCFTPEHLSAIREAVRSEDSQLTSIEQEVLRFRFGLFAGQNPPKLTLEKAGNKLGISKERVRQVQLRAMRKIRENIEHQLPTEMKVG